MGQNNWTPEQWRIYNRRTGDRHLDRQPPLSLTQMLEQDVKQERELARLLHRTRTAQDRHMAEFFRRERAFIRVTRPLTHYQTGEDHIYDD